MISSLNPSHGQPTASGSMIALSDIAALMSAFMLSYVVFNHLTLLPMPPNSGGYLTYFSPFERHFLYGLIGVIVIGLFLNHGHYTQRLPWWNQVRLISKATFFAFLIENAANFLLNVRASGWLILINWILAAIFLILFRSIFARLRENSKDWKIPTVVIGDPVTVTDILYAFNSDHNIGYDIHTILVKDREGGEPFDETEVPRRYKDLKIVYNPDDYKAYIAANPDNFYVIVLESFRGIMRERIVETLNKSQANYAFAPSSFNVSLYEMEPQYFFGYDVMLLHTKSALSQPGKRLGKRLLDIAASGAALVLFAPLFAVLIAALKLERHEGSLFYGGERVGQNNKLFKCWKFRTMRPDSDHLLEEYLNAHSDARAHWEKYFKLPKDPRVKTRTARFLRKSSLDEIPQLWNVFIGDMSLVGPRPILPNEVESYGGGPIDDYTRVKPGITGLWQVSGRNSVSFQRRVYWDRWYVRNWSLWGDIVIILKTVPAVLFRQDGH